MAHTKPMVITMEPFWAGNFRNFFEWYASYRIAKASSDFTQNFFRFLLEMVNSIGTNWKLWFSNSIIYIELYDGFKFNKYSIEVHSAIKNINLQYA